jgi:hypothetical protein
LGERAAAGFEPNRGVQGKRQKRRVRRHHGIIVIAGIRAMARPSLVGGLGDHPGAHGVATMHGVRLNVVLSKDIAESAFLLARDMHVRE